MAEFIHPDKLETDNFWLRIITTQDYANLYAAANDPLIWEQHPSKRYIESVFKGWFDLAIKDGNALIVTDKKTGQVVGSTRLYEFNQQDNSVALGYTFLKRDYWGTGANNEIKHALLNYAFAQVDKVWLYIAPENMRSRKAAEKLGAKLSHIGLIKASTLAHCYYLIKKEAFINPHQASNLMQRLDITATVVRV